MSHESEHPRPVHKRDGHRALQILIVVVLAYIAALVVMLALWGPHTDTTPDVTIVPPCAAEDGPGPCYWDADVRGNGTGRSFTMDHDGDVEYWKGE